MNRQLKFALLLMGLFCAIALALSGHYLIALVLWFALDSALAERQADQCFDNVLGTLNSALILQQALSLLFTTRPELNYFSTSLTDENGVQAKYNQQVIVRTKSVGTVGTFGDAAVDVATVDVPVTLNIWRQVFFKFTPQQYEATSRDLILEQAEPTAVAIGNDIIDQAAGVITKANFPGGIVKGAGWDYTHLTTARQTAQTRGLPMFKRFYLAASPVYTSFLNDPMVVAQFNNPDNEGAIKSGKLPVVANFGIAEYPALATAAGDATIVGFAGTPGAICIGSRAPSGPPKNFAQFPGNYGYITDPKSQFTIRVTEWIDPVTMNANVRADWIMGRAKGQANEGILITNA